VSAAAPALAKTQRRIVVVRLGDVAKAVTSISIAFGLLLVCLPVWFPNLIANSWQRGQLMPVMMALAFIVDLAFYLRVAQLQGAKPGILGAACLGSLPLLVIGGLSVVLQSAIKHTIATDLPNLQGRVTEEILAHTYLALIAGVFLPFLCIRVLEQLKATRRQRSLQN
jgi:hypothetical protein